MNKYRIIKRLNSKGTDIHNVVQVSGDDYGYVDAEGQALFDCYEQTEEQAYKLLKKLNSISEIKDSDCGYVVLYDYPSEYNDNLPLDEDFFNNADATPQISPSGKNCPSGKKKTNNKPKKAVKKSTKISPTGKTPPKKK